MTNQHAHLKAVISLINQPKIKKTEQPNYWKDKNRAYNIKTKEERKEKYGNKKVPLIHYYKQKYGEELTLNIIETYGLEQGLIILRNYKYADDINEFDNFKNSPMY